jgi:hypothetical protein
MVTLVKRRLARLQVSSLCTGQPDSYSYKKEAGRVAGFILVHWPASGLQKLAAEWPVVDAKLPGVYLVDSGQCRTCIYTGQPHIYNGYLHCGQDTSMRGCGM